MQGLLACRAWSEVGGPTKSAFTQLAANKNRFLIVKCPSRTYAASASQVNLSVKETSDQARGGLPRFFIERLPLCKGQSVRLDGNELWHMARALRMKEGNRLELFDGKGGLALCTIEHLGKDGASLQAEEEPVRVPPPLCNWEVVVACGSLKGGRADWLVEKCTELGASALQPLLTERSPSVGERIERWERVTLAATKQCQRLHGMAVREPLPIQRLLPTVASNWAYLATAGAGPLLESYRATPPPLKGGLLLVGPEGDFTEGELASLQSAGAVPVGLGPRRLRVETAAIAMLSALQMAGDTV
ncbi:ribosomal RNA small subunit methyltransferase [Klebsormidium nitens]|uniref:16S rRNA (uracil(1498)-N(3))-methyltransferase n=1 Tax=Klebsormidium nitens TaxID=105231 RepID=A0A1Y1IGV0_KLENI|nr:ribosomal RNA small subunit methyltransferase [Klebsormidium nitens]|eukprot:GAQ90090.1 ribosomal RNA small subunit methyltransferase [Klebsormidium nitens]